MITLDCESRDTALWSLSRIYGVPELEIEAFLKETDLDRHYDENEPENQAESELTLLFERALHCTPSPLDRVFWFHLTRAPHDADFGSGILPLNEALPKVWATILGIFNGTEHEAPLQEFREKGIPNYHYKLKVGNPVYAGPYAMLIRETAGNHNYLKIPEIVEDICNGYHAESGVMIHNTVIAALIPYVIKYWSRKQTGKDCVESAMYYLYCTAYGKDLSIRAYTCFDGCNCMIPREQIVKIEKVDRNREQQIIISAYNCRRSGCGPFPTP